MKRKLKTLGVFLLGMTVGEFLTMYRFQNPPMSPSQFLKETWKDTKAAIKTGYVTNRDNPAGYLEYNKNLFRNLFPYRNK